MTGRTEVVRIERQPAASPPAAYRGRDRRGILRKLDRPVSSLYAAFLIAGVATVPILFATVARALDVGPGPWSTGVADAAFVGFSVSAALLLFQWRIVGDSASVSLASTAAVAGLFFVPATTRPVAMAAAVAAALRAVSVLMIAPLTWRAVFGPEVRAELRPVRSFAGALVLGFIVALLLGLSPARAIIEAQPGGIQLVDLAAAIVTIVLSGLALIEGFRRRRVLFLGLAALLLSMSGASVSIAVGASGPWREASALFLFVGALEFVAVVGSQLQSAVNAVVIHDVRGRRRWEAAEAQLTEVHSRIQVQRHDVNSMLSAIDGTLLVLDTQREQLADDDIDRLLGAVREEVSLLRANLSERSNDDRRYDLAELIATIVSVRDSGQTRVRCELQPGIELRGRPDRIAVAVDNLLANAAIHAPAAQVSVRTRCLAGPQGTVAEIAVSDKGPGLSDAEVTHAFERGWRGVAATGRPGSGLGLPQCRDLVESEGGNVELRPTDPLAGCGQRGLTVRITIPAGSDAEPDHQRRRPVQMRVIDGGVAV